MNLILEVHLPSVSMTQHMALTPGECFSEGMLHSASILPLHSCERMKSNRHETFQYWTVGQCKITQDASISTYPPGS